MVYWNLLVGTYPTTAMLKTSTGVRDKVATSLLDLALLVATANSALVLPENAPTLVSVVVLALLTLDLMVASSSTLTSTITVKVPPLRATPDYLLLNPTVEALVVDASKVLYPAHHLLTASSSAAVDLVPALD